MKSHKSSRSKDKVQKPGDDNKQSGKSDSKRDVAGVQLDPNDDSQAPTRFEKVNADVKPVIEKRRKSSRRASRKSTRKHKEKEEEKEKEKEKGGDGTVDEQEAPPPEATAKSEGDRSTAAMMMAPVEKREEPSQPPQRELACETAEEQEYPENAAYAYELAKGKPKIVDKPKDMNPKPAAPPPPPPPPPPPAPAPPTSKPEPSKNNNNNGQENEIPKSDYIMKY